MQTLLPSLFLFSVIFTPALQAQTEAVAGNGQNVHYEIEATLDTSAQALSVSQTIFYTNTSQDTLREIVIQVPSNAFADSSNTAVREMQRLNSSENFRFSVRPRQSITITMLQFLSIGEEKEFPLQAFDFSDTILRLPLPSDLLPGTRLVVRLHFVQELKHSLKPHKKTHRHIDFDDWLPRISVYDSSGWHIEPFHLMMQQSDIYTEFSSYDVRLQVPADFFVIASGEALRPDAALSQIDADTTMPDTTFSVWRDSLRKSTAATARGLPAKTIHYRSENSLNFTWTACTDLLRYSKDSLVPVVLYAHGSDNREWEKSALKNIDSALVFLHNWFGSLPFDTLRIVQAKNGSYQHPGLVMLDEADGMSLTSSLASTWIPATVGLNGLTEGWLYRGLVLFLGKRFNERQYGDAGYDRQKVRQDMGRLARFYPLPSLDAMFKTMTRLYRNSGMDERIAQPLYAYRDPVSALANMYLKADLFFEMLEYVVGRENMQRILRQFYQENRFRHAGTHELRSISEEVFGEDLGWFFEQWLNRTPRIDYSKGTVKTIQRKDGKWQSTIELKREGDGIMPVDVELALPSGEKIRRRWDGKEKEHLLTVITDEKPRAIVVDPEDSILDDNRLNNDRLRIEFRLDVPLLKYYYQPNDRYLVLWKPTAAYNSIDGLKFGLSTRGSYRALFNRLKADIQLGLRSRRIDGLLAYSHPLRRENVRNRFSLLARKKEGRYEYKGELSLHSSGGIISGTSTALRLGLSHVGVFDMAYLDRPVLQAGQETTIPEWQKTGISSVFAGLDFLSRTSGEGINTSTTLWAEMARSSSRGVFGLLQFRQKLDYSRFGFIASAAINGGYTLSPSNVPIQAAFFPADASPLQRFRADVMMTGSDWTASARRFTEGGARLRGYAGRMTPLSSYLSTNLELASTMTFLGIRPFFFYDAGRITQTGAESSTTLKNAGFGLRIPRIKTPFFGGAVSLFENMSVRLYIPWYLSQPAGGESKKQMRWLIAFGKEL